MGRYGGTLRWLVSQLGGFVTLMTGCWFGGGAGVVVAGFGFTSLWCNSYSARIWRKVIVRAFSVVVTDIADVLRCIRSIETSTDTCLKSKALRGLAQCGPEAEGSTSALYRTNLAQGVVGIIRRSIKDAVLEILPSRTTSGSSIQDFTMATNGTISHQQPLEVVIIGAVRFLRSSTNCSNASLTCL